MPWRMQFYKYYQLSVQNPSKFLKMWQIADFCQDHDTRDPQIITLFLWSKNFQCSCIKYMIPVYSKKRSLAGGGGGYKIIDTNISPPIT